MRIVCNQDKSSPRHQRGVLTTCAFHFSQHVLFMLSMSPPTGTLLSGRVEYTLLVIVRVGTRFSSL